MLIKLTGVPHPDLNGGLGQPCFIDASRVALITQGNHEMIGQNPQWTAVILAVLSRERSDMLTRVWVTETPQQVADAVMKQGKFP